MININEIEDVFKPELPGFPKEEWEFIKECFQFYYPKIELTKIHEYIFHLVSGLYDSSKDELKFKHIHIPVSSESFSNQLGIFLMVTLRFYEIQEGLKNISDTPTNEYYYINNKIETPKSINKLLSKYSDTLSGKSTVFNVLFQHKETEDKSKKKGEIYDRSGLTGAKWKKSIIKQNEKNKQEISNYKLLGKFIEFYLSRKHLNGIKELDLYPSVIFTCLTGYDNWIQNNYTNIWNSLSIEEINKTVTKIDLNKLRPIITNSKLNYRDFYDDDGQYQINGKSIFYDLTKTIVLFNTLSRSLYNGFNLERLKEHVEDFDGKLRRYLIVTFNKDEFYSYVKTHEDLEKVNTRYKIGVDKASVVISPLDSQNDLKFGNIFFEDINIYYVLSSFYDNLFLHNPEAYSKYLSIWFFNILSNICCKNIQLKVWKNISKDFNDNSNLAALKKIYFNLSDAIIGRNRDLLSSFSKKHRSGSFNKITKRVVIPSIFLSNIEYKSSISKLKEEFRVKFIDWKSFKSSFSKETKYLILDYRDTRFDHKLSCNSFDAILNSSNIECHFLSELFKKRFFINTRDYLQKIFKSTILSSARITEFNLRNNALDKFMDQISNEIPNIQSIDNDFSDVDDTDYDPPSSESIKIYFEGRQHTFSKSEKLLIKKNDSTKHYIIRADNLINYEDVDQYEGQRIYELYEKLDLYEDKKVDKEEISQFKSQLNINLPDEQWLWKYLLKKKVEESSLDSIYSDLENLSKDTGFFLVSKKTFLDSYLDYKNPSLPREKKATRSICNYLNLPSSYYRLIIRYKARQVLKSRKSNAKMDRLLSTLIQFDLFPVFKHNKYEQWFDYINKNGGIDLEDIGIFENEKVEIEILVDFLNEELNLRKISKVKILLND